MTPWLHNMTTPLDQNSETWPKSYKGCVTGLIVMSTSKAPAAIDDPRVNGYPCDGNHKQGKTRSNQWASWSTCLKCGLRLSYVVKKPGHGNTRQMGPDPHLIRLAMSELEKKVSKQECTAEMVNGKMLEIKGKMLQMGLSSTLQINMTYPEYLERLEKFGRADGKSLGEELVAEVVNAASTCQPTSQGYVTAEMLNLDDKELAKEIKESKKMTATKARAKAKNPPSPVKVEKKTDDNDVIVLDSDSELLETPGQASTG